MSRWTRSVLLAAALSSLPAPGARALVEPVWDCGIVAVRDIVTPSTNVWVATEWAYLTGIPTLHNQIKVTCWLQFGRNYNPATKIPGTNVTCPVSDKCVFTVPSTTYTAAALTTLYWCGHAQWYDTVTLITTTVRTSTCIKAKPERATLSASVLIMAPEFSVGGGPG